MYCRCCPARPNSLQMSTAEVFSDLSLPSRRDEGIVGLLAGTTAKPIPNTIRELSNAMRSRLPLHIGMSHTSVELLGDLRESTTCGR